MHSSAPPSDDLRVEELPALPFGPCEQRVDAKLISLGPDVAYGPERTTLHAKSFPYDLPLAALIGLPTLPERVPERLGIIARSGGYTASTF